MRESVFTLEATPIKFGPGAVDDAGWELKRLGVTRALLVTDPGVAASGHPDRVREAIEREGIEVVVYDRARVEPELDSLQQAADFALDAGVDGFVSVGGGSAIDTAKVADLIVSHPAPVMEYVNPPIGDGRAPAGPAEAAPGDPDHVRHRQRGDDRRRARHPRPQGQDRHLAPLPAAGAGDRRPRAGPHAGRRGRRRRAGSTSICHAAESFLSKPYTAREKPATPGRSPAVPGREPGRRRVVAEGARVRRAASCAAPSPTPTTSRRAAR